MKYVGDRDAFALGLMGIGAQLFFAITIDQPGLLNAGWLTALAACLLSLPLAFCLSYLGKRWAGPPAQRFTGGPARLFALALCLFSLFDTGCTLRHFTLSAQHLALESLESWMLIPLLILAATLGCLSGAQAVGSAARVALWFFLAMMVIIVAAQLRFYNGRWLAPVLGPGAAGLVKPVPCLAGFVTALAPLWLMTGSRDKAPRRYGMPALVGCVALVTGVLLVLFSMLAPLLTGVPDSRLFRFDRLLTNGRIATSLQLLMLLAWHTCMMTLLGFSLICAGRMLALALPRVSNAWCVCLCALASLLVPAFQLTGPDLVEWVNLIRWPLVTLPVLGAALACAIRSRKERRA